MLGYIKGSVIAKVKDDLIIETGNIGYRISVSPLLLQEAIPGSEIELYLHETARENAIELYGFKNLDELDLFESLLSVCGVGPKSALALLGLSTSASIRQAISRGEADTLTKVSGVGRKTAERIILELRSKIGVLPSVEGGHTGVDDVDALVSLGYSATQARDALNKVDGSITDSSERVRQALKNI